MNDPGHMAVNIIWAVVMGGALIASLLTRRLPIGRIIRMAAAWVVIFALVYAGSLYRQELLSVWQRVRDDIGGTRTATVDGRATVIRRDDDGHYRITGQIDGHAITFLIDTGASVTVVDRSDADRIGLTLDPSKQRQQLMTAGGVIAVAAANPVTLDVGTIHRTAFVLWVAGNTGGTNVLGVDWLNQLSSWRVEEGNLFLIP